VASIYAISAITGSSARARSRTMRTMRPSAVVRRPNIRHYENHHFHWRWSSKLFTALKGLLIIVRARHAIITGLSKCEFTMMFIHRNVTKPVTNRREANSTNCAYISVVPVQRNYITNTRGDKYALLNTTFCYNILFSAHVAKLNSLLDTAIDVDTVHLFKARLDRLVKFGCISLLTSLTSYVGPIGERSSTETVIVYWDID